MTESHYPTPPGRLEGRRVLITGATGELGALVAEELAAQGATVIATGRDFLQLEKLLSVLSGNGHTFVTADLLDSDLKRLMSEAVVGGPLDGLVHCAGSSSALPLRLLTRERVLEDLQVNYLAFIELVRQFSRRRNHNKGSSIVVISSIASVQPSKCQTSYSAAKSALDSAVRSLAIELAPSKIRVNSVLPGAVSNSAIIEAHKRGLDVDAIKQRQLLGFVEPESIAKTVTYLLSRESAAMTGRRVFLDGGIF